ncbi:MAG: DUF1549 domain-containing protein, partial [Planctomycetaceae bacterium]
MHRLAAHFSAVCLALCPGAGNRHSVWLDAAEIRPETVSERVISPADREHWAYQPIRNPTPPAVSGNTWIRTPVDRFILAKLEAAGLSPAPPAAQRELLRRLYLDVIGLPPTIAEQDAFLASPAPEKFDRAVAELLKRPGYGERWARHWLDLVRYADTNGYERDGTKPAGWRYRDWVIDSLNTDKPYDRFVLEQLAGDELDDASSETVLATGFYRLGPWDDEPAAPAQDLHDQRDDMIRTVSQVFIGLTLGCARCHDHKFDALTMHDYYRMSAILAPLDRPRNGRKELTRPAGSLTERQKQNARNRHIARHEKRIQSSRTAAANRVLAGSNSGLTTELLTAFRAPVDRRSPGQQTLVEQNQTQLDTRTDMALTADERASITQEQQAIAEIRKNNPDLPEGYFLFEPDETPPETHLLLRGCAATLGPPVKAGLPAILTPEQPRFSRTSQQTSGRRLALTQWM